MQDPFAKYGDYHQAQMFAGEYRRDNQGGSDATLVLAAWAAVLEDVKRAAAGKEPLPAHKIGTQRSDYAQPPTAKTGP
jgi:hypothetical protein